MCDSKIELKDNIDENSDENVSGVLTTFIITFDSTTGILLAKISRSDGRKYFCCFSTKPYRYIDYELAI